jgi:V/A-type H+-transporting ATPase subunit D
MTMKLSVPPTKSSALAIANELGFATEGHDLLEQKRQILVLELMQHVDAAKHSQTDVDEHLADAHAALRDAATRAGSQNLARDALAVPLATSLHISQHRVMGMSVPEIKAEHPPVEPTFAFADGTIKSDDVTAAFSKALEGIASLAETQNAVFRLARELRKTQRRVNALDKVFIPDYRETLDFITATLEERERESFVILRIIRDRLRRRSAGSRRTGGE